MSTPITNKHTTSTTTPVTPKKNARLISKDLDRSPYKLGAKGALPSFSKRGASSKYNMKAKNLRRLRGKSRKPSKKWWPKNPASNYEDNRLVRPDFTIKENPKEFTFRFSPRNHYARSRAKRIGPLVGLATADTLPALRRALIHQHQPAEHTSCDEDSRLDVNRPLGRLVSIGLKVDRSKHPAKTRFWTAKKRTELLHVVDKRLPGKRIRRRGRPRVSVTYIRARIAHQLIRKFRAVGSTKHRSIRRRFISFLWFNRKFLKKLKYPRKKRMLRRATRRLFRYTQTTVVVLNGALRKTKLLRSFSRAKRVQTRRAESAAYRLLVAEIKGLTPRQQFFSQQESARKLRALRLLETKNRRLYSIYRAKLAFNLLKLQRGALRLHRKLPLRRSKTKLDLNGRYRFASLLQREGAARTPRWLETKSNRVKKTETSTTKYLTSTFAALQQYRTNRRIRQVAGQKQLLTVAAPAAGAHLKPIAANNRYSDLFRRVEFKTRLANALPPRGLADNKITACLSDVTPLAGTSTTTLWRQVASPSAKDRFQLPYFARNLALRNRASSLSSRTATAPYAEAATVAHRAGSILLRARRSNLLEKRFYRRRALLRLPKTAVKRWEARRIGVKLFTRNTLKSPKTWSGKRKLLLPVAQTYTLTSRTAAAPSLAQTDFRHVRRRLSYYPRVWTRAPGRRESAMVYDIREKKRNRSIRTNLIKAKLLRKKVATSSAPSSLAAANTLVGNFVTSKPSDGANLAARAKLAVYRERILRPVRYIHHRNLRQVPLMLSGLTVGRTALQSNKLLARDKKQKALWHLRSVQKMLTAERLLSAWSPQYSNKWRRWSSPRVEGFPTPRQWPSRKELRQREAVNAALAYRGKPKRKHFDRAYGHLQFHRGSAATVGYERFRRSHRTRSKNNRWWKPVTCPAPFTSPYSRRSINAKKHITKRLSRHHAAYQGEVGTRTRGIKGVWFPVAQPPRLISSNNIKIARRRFERVWAYKRREKMLRAKLPANLQRWTLRAEKYRWGSTASPRKTVTLNRTKRSIRKLENLYPQTNAWSSGSWQNLDLGRVATTSAAALFSAGCQKLPHSFWNTLYQTYNTQTAALTARAAIFARFSVWHKQFSATCSGHQLLLAATRRIANLVDEANDTHKNIATTRVEHAVALKKDRFWRLRTLPKLNKNSHKNRGILNKNNGALYKRWLHGAQRYLKRSRSTHLPPKHRRGGAGLIINFGLSRRRFPASGRRRHSYDAMLHAFARRTAPARFRKINPLKFKRVKRKISASRKLDFRKHEISSSVRRQRRLARKLGRVAYLSPSWRELLSYRASSPVTLPSTDFVTAAQKHMPYVPSNSYPAEYAQPFSSGVKRRFASLPINLLFKRAAKSHRTLRAKTVISLRTQRTSLLRAALRQRRQERVFIDLKRYLSRRKLPKEELSTPWKRKKRARRKEQHLRYGDWSPRHFQFQKSKTVFWTMHDLEERVPRRKNRVRTVLKKGVTNELFKLPQLPPKKLVWAKKGFQIKFPVLKAHRRVRRDKKRRRRGRSRVTKERRARFRHTSERENMATLKRISGKVGGQLLNTIHDRGQKLLSVKASLRWKRSYKGKSLLRGRWLRPTQRILAAKTHLSLKKKNGKRHGLNVALSATSLLPFSSVTRPKKLTQLSLRAAANKNKFARRMFAALRRNLNSTKVGATEVELARLQAAKALHKFTASAITPAVIAPLAFQRLTKLVVKSEEEKKRAVIWNIKSKERRYKRTAQYALSLTTYIPSLISHMLSQKIKNSNIPYALAKTLISATYWNLRVYLNVDPFEKRLTLRDTNVSFLRKLASNISFLAKEQITEHADRTHLRKRFQSCRIHPAPTSDRFRLDWLRAFFPRKHALFQEDPEEYASILVSTRNIRRLIPSGYGIARWRTAPAPVSLERSSRQLLRLRLSKCAPRFETVLQTTRRTPLTEIDSLLPEMDYEAASANAELLQSSTKKKSGVTKQKSSLFEGLTSSFLFNEHTPAHLGFSAHRNSFFQRQFSTQAVHIAGAVARFISRRNRLLIFDQNTNSATTLVVSRYHLKKRTEARGRSSFTGHAQETIDAGGLDPRFLRYKSPRSRQYLVRLPAVISHRSDQEKVARLLAFRELCDNPHGELSKLSLAKGRRVRIARRYFYRGTPPGEVKKPISAVRELVSTRRAATFLHSRSFGVADTLSFEKHYHFPNRRQLTFNADYAEQRAAKHHIRYRLISTQRSILQYRAAKKRTTEHFYKADRILRKLPFSLRAQPKRAARTGKKAALLLHKLKKKCSSYLNRIRFAKDKKKKDTYRGLFIRAQRGLQRAQNRLATIRMARISAAEKISRPFRNRAFRRLAAQRQFDKKCMRLQASRRRMIFDTSRPRLWHRLTGRWMKRERFMRNWLKGVKRWFRDPWLSKTVDISTRRHRPGEIRAREQQVGEVVAGDELAGYTKEERLALKKAALPAILAAKKVVTADLRRARKLLKRANPQQKKVLRSRRRASQEALRTPRPTMWLANLQAKQKTAEVALWRTKTRKEKDEIRLARKEAAIARAKAGKRPLARKKDPLKMPASHWMPSIVWKDIQRRARRLEWRESDDVFTRKGFRNAFRFYPSERNRAPWLESLMYNRSLFSTRLREFRRRQFPKEQKKYKWLQRVRKSFFPGRTNVYIRWRRWPRLRIYNQRLHYTLFNLPDKNAARRHFKKLNRRSRKVGFVDAQTGLSNRLDNVLIHLNMVPTIFWSRVLAPYGVLRVNGRVVTDADYLFKPGDFIEPSWEKVLRFRHYFTPSLPRREETRRPKRFSLSGIPKNLHYHKGIRCFTFVGNPKEEDLRRSSRLQPHLFRWFRLDSV